MNKQATLNFLALGFIFMLSGCIVRTYPLTRDRIDQDLSAGNRGYIQGEAPSAQERKSTRTTQVLELELRSPIKFEKKAKEVPIEKAEEAGLSENRGFISQGAVPLIIEQQAETVSAGSQEYTVQKGDTLQKISKKFYGTTKRWNRIYEANKGALKGPNKIYPGQVIYVPVEPMKETRENLK